MASTLQRVLDLWRASERELAEQSPDSPETSALTNQIDRLRRLYQTITLHERRDLRRLREPDQTVVSSELLAVRTRASAERAEAAVQRSRSVRLAAHPEADQRDEATLHRS